MRFSRTESHACCLFMSPPGAKQNAKLFAHLTSLVLHEAHAQRGFSFLMTASSVMLHHQPSILHTLIGWKLTSSVLHELRTQRVLLLPLDPIDSIPLCSLQEAKYQRFITKNEAWIFPHQARCRKPVIITRTRTYMHALARSHAHTPITIVEMYC